MERSGIYPNINEKNYFKNSSPSNLLIMLKSVL